MKRTIRRLALVLALVLALSAAAMATELTYTEANAQGNVHAASLVDGCELKFDGDKLNVTYTNSALKEGDMVIVFLLETADKKEITDDTVELSIMPTSSNIKYIDQKYIDQGTAAATATAGNGSVSFSVYPQNYTNAVVRIISVNKDGTLTDVNVAAVKLNYTLGDVDGSGAVTVIDAQRVLQFITHRDETEYALQVPLAGDVDKSGAITVIDAQKILQFITHRDDQAYWLGQ